MTTRRATNVISTNVRTLRIQTGFIEQRLGCDLGRVEQAVESIIHQRRNDAMAAFIRMGEVEVETRVLGEDLTRFDDDSAMPAGDRSHDVVVFTVEAERPPAVGQFPGGEGEARRDRRFF